jgi:hypothetical protein
LVRASDSRSREAADGYLIDRRRAPGKDASHPFLG